LQRLLTRTTVVVPLQWQTVHDGYRSQAGDLSYSSRSSALNSSTIEHDPASVADHVVFLVDEQSTIPPIALALQRAGQAAIVSVGPLFEDRFVSHVDVSLGEGFHAVVRTSELQQASGPSGATIIPASSNETAILQTATALLGSPAHRRAVSPTWTPGTHKKYTWRADAAYDDMTYPPVEYRILAAYRL
jgi:hypothetical protein